MASVDLDYIMNVVKNFGTDYFSKSQNDSSSVSVYGTTLNLRRGSKTEESACYFNEIPPFMLAVMREQTKVIMEYIRTDKKEMQEDYDRKLKEKDAQIADLKSEIRSNKNDHDALATYNRRENLKIVGVKYEEGENTNEIVKEICKLAGREIKDADISTSHRNGSTNNRNNPPGMANTTIRHPDIICRFVQRDVKIGVFEGRKNIATNPNCPPKYKDVTMYEDVTPLRSRIMYELRQRGDKKTFKYVWSRGGRIFCRTPEEAEMTTVPRPHVINKPEDLLKLNFTESEVEAIILNKRD